MRFRSPLVPATLLRRYKRFFADVRLEDGSEITVHCANTGSMLGIVRPNAPCLLLDSMNPLRRLRYTLQAIRVGRVWVGTHPVVANIMGKEALLKNMVDGIGPILSVRGEVPFGQGSRADLLLQLADGTECWVEVKSASMADGRTSLFPDSVTERGQKHLAELMRVVRMHDRALMLFVATRNDVDRFCPASQIDPVYAERLAQAVQAGVIVRAITTRTTRTTMTPVRPISVHIP